MIKDAKLEVLKAFYEKHGLNFSLWEICLIQNMARKHQREAVNLCNIPNYQDQYDKSVKRHKEKLSSMIEERHRVKRDCPFALGNFKFGGDPRGFAFYIIAPTNETEIYPERYN